MCNKKILYKKYYIKNIIVTLRIEFKSVFLNDVRIISRYVCPATEIVE